MKTEKLKGQIKLFKFFAMVNLMLSPIAISAYAQGAGHVGGGDPTASDFQDYINKIDRYLLTDEGKLQFPELKQPDFHNIVIQVKPVVKDERVYDSFGVAQACASHVEEGNRYFQCDVTRLPKVELNNQPTFYRITLHELLFQAGLELPISREIPSDFSISSRLKLRLETYQEWIPGIEGNDNIIYGVTCTYDQFVGRGSIEHPQHGRVYFFPEGTIFYNHSQDPRGYTGEHRYTYHGNGKMRLTGSYRLLSVLGEKSKVLEEGESKSELNSWNTLEAFTSEIKIDDTRRMLRLLMPPLNNYMRATSSTGRELKTGLLVEEIYSKKYAYQIIKTQQYSCEWMELNKTRLDKIIEETRSWFFKK